MMRVRTALLNSGNLKGFREMADLDHTALQVVMDNAEICVGRRGEKLVELMFNDPCAAFLLQGSVLLEGGLLQKKRVARSDREASSMLNGALPKGGKVLSQEDGTTLLLIRQKFIHAARLDYRDVPAASFGRFGWVADGEVCETEQDWMTSLLSSPLFQRIQPGKLQLLFTSLQEKHYEAGEVVIRSGQSDEYFYILKSGIAEVLLSNYRDHPIRLEPGSFFGEGALTGDTVHSATVRMVEAGIVCLVHAEDFEKLLKGSLLEFVTPQQLEILLQDTQNPAVVLDVRYGVEHRHGHRTGSLHVPLSMLREKLRADILKDRTYLIDFGEDKRSQVAALIMIEHGFNALLIPAALAAT